MDLDESSSSDWRENAVSVEEALEPLESGQSIFLGSACATPRSLIHGLEASESDLSDIRLVHYLTDGAIPEGPGGAGTRFRHRLLFVGQDMRPLVESDRADYIPISLLEAARLLRSGRLEIDAALVQVSPPDEHGQCSLGVSVDLTWTVLQCVRTVIAEINPRLPRPRGEATFPFDRIDRYVVADNEVIEYLHPPAADVAQQIARYVARIIDDGSTLQIGLGQIPNEMLRYLAHRRDLGIHSDVITEPIVDLIESGVINGRRKSHHKGKIIASFCMGTRRLYDLVDDNPAIELRPIEYVADPERIASQERMVSVTQAFAVDLTGQVCSDQFDGKFYGGVSCQPEFSRGAAAAPGGKPIVCLASRTDDDRPRIRARLLSGEGVSIARSDVHYVVTEYGIAYLFGRSIAERALALIEIAHPDDRDPLLEEARELGYLSPARKLRSRREYPVDEEREEKLRDGSEICIRPTRATDAEALRQLFHSLSDEDIYTRFFTQLQSFSDSMADHLCNVGYEEEMSFAAVIGEDFEDEEIVGNASYYLDPSKGLADIAFMVHPEWQGRGLGSLLRKRLFEYGREQGLRGFSADVLPTNEKMLAVFESSGLHTRKKIRDGVCELAMYFQPPTETQLPTVPPSGRLVIPREVLEEACTTIEEEPTAEEPEQGLLDRLLRLLGA